MGENKEMKGTAEYVPASNSPAGNSDQITRDYLDSLLLTYRHMGNEIPSTAAKFFGEEFATPVTAGAIILYDKLNPEGIRGFAKGVRDAGALMWTGWLPDEEFEPVADTGAKVVRGIKPFENEDTIFRALETAERCGAAGVFMDIDHCFGDSGKDCEFVLGKLSHKTLEQLKAYVSATKLPFLFKGILSPADVPKCIEVGAAGIIVSHHKGIWSYAVPPLYILPEIRAAAGKNLTIFTDCGLRDGVDAFKALARGADGICVARPLMQAFGKGGAQAVSDYIKEMTDELAGTMAKTGAANLAEIDPAVIRERTW